MINISEIETILSKIHSNISLFELHPDGQNALNVLLNEFDKFSERTNNKRYNIDEVVLTLSAIQKVFLIKDKLMYVDNDSNTFEFSDGKWLLCTKKSKSSIIKTEDNF